MKPTAALLALSLMSTTASAAPLAPERAAALTRQLEAIMKDPAMPLPGPAASFLPSWQTIGPAERPGSLESHPAIRSCSMRSSSTPKPSSTPFGSCSRSIDNPGEAASGGEPAFILLLLFTGPRVRAL